MTDNLVEINRRKQKTDLILSNIHNLPSIPLIILEVTKLIEDPRTSAAQLGKVIGKDQGLVAKILTVANSPLYGIPRRVSTIDFAIVILGFNHIKNIVIALSMIEAFKSIKHKEDDEQNYWYHCILVASASKRIADDLGFYFSGEAFTAGLLHDIGIRIIQNFFPKEYKLIIHDATKNGMSYKEAELSSLGLTHEEIGKHLLDRWNLPISLTDVILYHHEPNLAENNKVLTAIVHIADYMTQKFQIGNFSWDDGIELDKDVIKILDLGNEEYIEKLINSYKILFEEQIKSLNVNK